MRTLILSDLHLGNRHSHTDQLLATLKNAKYDRLILNGDTLHNLNLRKFRPEHWRIVDLLRRIGATRQLTLIRGNHDHELDDEIDGDGQNFASRHVLPMLLGVPMVEECEIQAGGRRYLVTHGDQFDPTLSNVILSELAGCCYTVSRKIHKKLAKWLKKKTKRWSGALEKIKLGLVGHAQKRGYEGVIAGHTHFVDDVFVDTIHYLNSGCWTEPPCTYLGIVADKIECHHVAE